MTNDQTNQPSNDEYSYYRTTDGCDDVFLIEDTDGRCLLKLHFWNEPDTNEAAVAEQKARQIVEALNLPGGGWAQTPYADWVLRQDRQVATIWCIQDVIMLRPDLTEDQAWEVLQAVDRRLDANNGITREMLQVTARDLFPLVYQRTGEPCI
jgi:hypothetical protein